MIRSWAPRWALGLCGLALVALAAPDAMAWGGGGHGGGHGGGGHGGFGGFHGGFDHGFRGGFGFGCCYGGFGYYDPFYAYGYGYPPAYDYSAAPYYGYSPPTYVSPSTSPYASGETPPLAYDASNPPTNAPEASAGDCREYQSPVVIGGRREMAYGYACRQPDGTWRVTTP
ncbi:MAG TPA: hypothetical protein VMB81_27390 [Candidatus Sulfotelmatobacter sp.]|nr:hypothetical protein [Candidatus Sulfotelmatobacter sp.]